MTEKEETDARRLKDFEARYSELNLILLKRKHSWTLSTIDWDDVSSMLMIRLWQKFHMYDAQKGPLEKWANRVISNGISNILRDNLYRFSKPCIRSTPSGGNCVFNLPGEGCKYTKSGLKCGECKPYAKWLAKKESLFNIKSSLSLENHAQEVNNVQEDFFNVADAKRKIDEKVMARLNAHEASIYRMLFIDNIAVEEVSKKLKYKASSNSNVSQVLRKMVGRFKQIAREVIDNEDLA